MKRSYKTPALIKIAAEISKIDSSTLLEYKQRDIFEVISLVLTWHCQSQGNFKKSHLSHLIVATKFPEFRTSFKEPPIVAYGRPKRHSSCLAKNGYISKENSTAKEQWKSKTMINNV